MILSGISEDQQTISINLKAVENIGDECDGCYFKSFGGCRKTCCTPSERIDGKNIIWEEV